MYEYTRIHRKIYLTVDWEIPNAIILCTYYTDKIPIENNDFRTFELPTYIKPSVKWIKEIFRSLTEDLLNS